MNMPQEHIGCEKPVKAVRSAFTLIEVLIVVVLLGILAALVVPQFSSATDEAYNSLAHSFESALRTGKNLYFSKHEKLPTGFSSWVGGSESSSSTNLVFVETALRRKLQDPEASVVESQRIALTFKNGLVATYTIDNTGTIRATYVTPQ